MIMVTGANGQLASLTLDELRARGVRAIGGSRMSKDGGRRLDFDDPTSLDLAGVSTLVLISAGYAEDDQVIARHQAVVDAAVRDGVSHIVYTSLTGSADHVGFALAHRATERLVKASGLEWTILRNGLYAQLFGALLTWTPDGLESAFGEGALSAVARADLAAAAAVAATAPASHAGRPTTWSATQSPPATSPSGSGSRTAPSASLSTAPAFLLTILCCRSNRRCWPRS